MFPVQADKRSAYALEYKTIEKNHGANPRTLDVLCPLLVAEGQGADPRASGNINEAPRKPCRAR